MDMELLSNIWDQRAQLIVPVATWEVQPRSFHWD